MKTSKVTKIDATGESWESRNGTMYVFRVHLEDGTEGEVNAKSQDGPAYSEGDTVEYTVQREHNGVKKLTVKKEGSGYSQGGKTPSRAAQAPSRDFQPKDTRGIEVGQALNKAVDVVIAVNIVPLASVGDHDGLRECMKGLKDKVKWAAQQILDAGDELRKEGE